MSQKPHERFMMSFSEAARVLGISKRTFENGFKKGLYAEIHVEKHLGGWQANLLDVFHYAYPTFTEETIAKLIYQYRADLVERRGKKK